MATLYEYYEKDFQNTVKLYIKIDFRGIEISGCVLYDFSAACAYVATYIPNKNFDIEFYKAFIEKVANGGSVKFDHLVKLPSLSFYDGEMKFTNNEKFEVLSRFWGEQEWKSTNDISHTKRIFIYSEKDFSSSELSNLYDFAKSQSCNLQFRSIRYRDMRIKEEKPKAFICHDSRDKEAVAKPLALALQRLYCPVWYDEFSLKIGDNLRTSIEKGLRECKKCILVLSKNFLTNKGWTQTEFDSIFTRQIFEQTNLILPIWLDVSKEEIYTYSPSLLNVKGLNWSLGEEEISKQIFKVIED